MCDIKFENLTPTIVLDRVFLADTMDSVQNFSHMYNHMQSLVS
jgi:hypothetical protein